MSVQSNHIHIVVSAGHIAAEQVMTHLKAYASRNLNAEYPAESRQRWWTRHGSTRYIKSKFSLCRAVEYVKNQ